MWQTFWFLIHLHCNIVFWRVYSLFKLFTAPEKNMRNHICWTRKADSPFCFLHAFGNNSELSQLLRRFQQVLGWATKVTRWPLPAASSSAHHRNQAPAEPLTGASSAPLTPPAHTRLRGNMKSWRKSGTARRTRNRFKQLRNRELNSRLRQEGNFLKGERYNHVSSTTFRLYI